MVYMLDEQFSIKIEIEITHVQVKSTFFIMVHCEVLIKCSIVCRQNVGRHMKAQSIPQSTA